MWVFLIQPKLFILCRILLKVERAFDELFVISFFVCRGQYFDKHLKFIKLNEKKVPFTEKDLSYLLKVCECFC